MDYYLYPPFFGVEPQTSFDEAWEVFCCELLNLEHDTQRIRRRTPPDLGADLIWDEKNIIYQCKASEDGQSGSFSIDKAIKSLNRAIENQETLGWQRYVLCTNVDITGVAEQKLKAVLSSIEILSRTYWIGLCNKFHEDIVITSRFRYPSLSQPEPIWSIPHLRNPFFTGREEVLTQIYENLNVGKKTALTQPQAINGLGGIGKTQCAVEYAYRHRQEYRYTLWVNASTHETLTASYVDLASYLQLLIQKELEQDKIVLAVKHWLNNHDNWLLIMDNADDLNLASQFLPTANTGHIILTTRDNAPGEIAQGIEVDTMSRNEGVELLLLCAKILSPQDSLMQATDTQRQEAETLVEELGALPLALAQAGAYIEETRSSLSKYLKHYRTRRKELLQRRGKHILSHPEPVATTWSLSFTYIEQANVAAADMLRLCAFLDSDSIPEELFLRESPSLTPALHALVDDEFLLEQAIEALLRFSLVRRRTEAKQLSMHRLVQAVIKDEMNPHTYQEWAERAIRVVYEAFPAVDVSTWEQCRRYLPHAQACLSVIMKEHYTFAEAVGLLMDVARYAYDHALYSQAEPLNQRALAIYEQMLGADHPDTAHSLNDLATLYTAQGKYEQAEPLYLRALSIDEQQFGLAHPISVTVLNNLALCYKTLGKNEHIELLYQRALSAYEDQLGLVHPYTANVVNNLASLYTAQGKYEQAEPLYQRALSIREQQLGPMHPDTANSLSNLGQLYKVQGKYEEAELRYKRALAICEKVLGSIHPHTAITLNNLANLYTIQRKYEQAAPLLQRALAILEQSLGADHPETATILNNLGFFYQAQGKYEQAEPFYRRALTIRKQVFGPDHPATIDIRRNLYFFYEEKSKQSM